MLKMPVVFLFIAIIVVISAFYFFFKRKTKAEQDSIPPTEKGANQKIQKEHLSRLDYNLLLENDQYKDTPLEVIDLGKLTVSSGLLIAEDPLVMLSAEPFVQSVKPGRYPVRIVVGKTRESGERFALAQLQFSEKKADKWVLALKKNDDASNLKNDEFLGFPVDAGLACFADKTAADQYIAFEDNYSKEHPQENIYDDLLADLFKKNAKEPNNPNDPGNWLDFRIPHTESNIIMFQSGYGDGVYPCYWGVTKEGETVSLVIDFMIF